MFKTAVAQSFDAIVITNANLQGGGPHIEYCNTAFCELTGYSADELIGQSPRILQGPETDPIVIDRLRECLVSGDLFVGNTVNYRKNGQAYHVEWNIYPVRDDMGEIMQYVSVQRDITARLAAERERDMLALAMHQMAAPVMIADANARIVFVNHAFEQLTGYRLDEIKKSTSTLAADVLSGDLQSVIEQDLQHGKVLRRTVLQRRRNGAPYFLDQTLSAVHNTDGEISYFVSVGKDVSGLIETQKKLKTLADTDELTGLFNRRYGERKLAEYEAKAKDRHGAATLLVCDIDLFKGINDRFGHAAGDEALKRVTQQISSLLRGSDVIIRWGGDEFLVILPNTPEDDAIMLARMLGRVAASVSDAPVGRVTLSIRLAVWGQGEASSSVLSRADSALYKAKKNGRNRVQAADSTHTC